MVFGGMILTNKGREALTRAQLGGQLNFTGVAVGDGSYGPRRTACPTTPSPPSPGVRGSTAEALAWDAAFKNMNEPSGRAVKGVHEEAYDS